MLNNYENNLNLKYCLYARKSSESDEKQAMSISSQLGEMRELAEREGLDVVAELQASHSTKDSGKRPVYTEMLKGIADGDYALASNNSKLITEMIEDIQSRFTLSNATISVE